VVLETIKVDGLETLYGEMHKGIFRANIVHFKLVLISRASIGVQLPQRIVGNLDRTLGRLCGLKDDYA